MREEFLYDNAQRAAVQELDLRFSTPVFSPFPTSRFDPENAGVNLDAFEAILAVYIVQDVLEAVIAGRKRLGKLSSGYHFVARA